MFEHYLSQPLPYAGFKLVDYLLIFTFEFITNEKN